MSDAAALVATSGSTGTPCRLPTLLGALDALRALDALHALDARAAMSGGAREAVVDRADADDIEIVLGGGGDAYARLVRRHQAGVARMMSRFARDAGVREQLVQDVFVEAWRSLRGYRGDAPFPHWLRRIATRVGYQHWRHVSRERTRAGTDDGALADDAAVSHDPTDPREAAELVHALLARLSARDRLVLTLVHLEGCGTQEVAELTGWSRTAVKVAAFRARKRLGALLKERGDM
ncbi:MAG: RNA polymerase sigma factor [Planctomycetota bacterium]